MSSRTSWVLPLDEVVDEPSVGAKARNLARLQREGHPVPQAVVVTNAAFEAFLVESDLQSSIASLCAKLDARSPLGMRCAAETIGALIRNATLPGWLCAQLDTVRSSFDGPLIVRSSAVGEDSVDASFAGQLDSVAGVNGAGLLRRALLDVWASRWSARVLAYQLARGVTLGGMGVVIQKQVDSVVSGVLFTELTPGGPGMLLEYCAGMGEALVSGRENPGRIAISRTDFRWTPQAAPEHPVPFESLLLDDDRIAALGRAALSIEQALGGPQDIEWTIDASGGLWLLQTRPITAAGNSAPPPGSHTRAVRWSNANVNENFPEPITPLLYSIARTGYYHYFRNLGRSFGISSRRLARMEAPLRQIIGVHGARMYYNLTSIHGVLRSAPFGEALTSSFNLFVGAESTDAPAAGARQRPRLIAQGAEAAVIVARTSWQYLFLTRRVERFERLASDFAARTHPKRLRTRRAVELLEDVRGFLDIRNHRWNGAALADAATMVCYGALQRLLARALPDADHAALHNNLLKALPGLVSSVPAVELWRLSRLVTADPRLEELFDTHTPGQVVDRIGREHRCAAFNRAFFEFVENWGFRCSGELMLTTPSFQETPEKLVDLIRAYMRLDGDSPAAQLERQASERMDETARVAALVRRRAGRLTQLALSVTLRWTQKAILLRERARLKQALLYSRLRRIALALGDRLAAAGRFDSEEDVFFLTIDELDSLVSGAEMFPDHVRPLVALRRHAHAELRAVTPPDSLTTAPGEYFCAALHSHASQPDDRKMAGVPELRGLGACGGTATARAAVLEGLADTPRLGAGDVLVTRQTDPGWGPVFPLISALVIERGGMLSHGAIIAREFGIPSVVGVREATTVIPHGSRIHVNGDLGTVRVVER